MYGQDKPPGRQRDLVTPLAWLVAVAPIVAFLLGFFLLSEQQPHDPRTGVVIGSTFNSFALTLNRTSLFGLLAIAGLMASLLLRRRSAQAEEPDAVLQITTGGIAANLLVILVSGGALIGMLIRLFTTGQF